MSNIIITQVMTTPVITQLSASPEAVLASGESLMIQCMAEGLPEPKVEWKKMPEDVSETLNFMFCSEYSLLNELCKKVLWGLFL